MPYITINVGGRARERYFVAAVAMEAFFEQCRSAARLHGTVLPAAPDAPRCPKCQIDLSEFKETGETLRYCPRCSAKLWKHFAHCGHCRRVYLPPLRGGRFCTRGCGELILSNGLKDFPQ